MNKKGGGSKLSKSNKRGDGAFIWQSSMDISIDILCMHIVELPYSKTGRTCYIKLLEVVRVM